MPVVLDQPTLSPATETVGGLIDDLARYMRAGVLGMLNELASPIDTADVTTLVLSHAEYPPAAGSWIGVELEVMHVWSYNAATKTATVRRGMQGSTAAPHAAGALVEIHPRFSRFELATTLQQEIAGWPSSLYALGSYETSFGSSTRSYDFPVDSFVRVLEVSYTPAGSYTPIDLRGFEVRRDQPDSVYASGQGILLPYAVSGPGRILYSKDFTLTPWLETTLLSDVGLTQSMTDIPVIGAAARLMLAREAPRSDSYGEGQSRLADEVPPGSFLQNARELERQVDKRLAREARRLRELFPYREG